MTPLFTAGTRPSSLQNESGFYPTDFSVTPARQHDDVLGVPAAGSAPEWLYAESYGLITDISMSGTPIPASGGAYQGIAALEDADTIASLANIIDDEVFALSLSTGTIVSRDPEFRKARSGNGREFTFNFKHGHYLT